LKQADPFINVTQSHVCSSTAAYDGWPGRSDAASDDAVEHADDVADQSTKEPGKRWGAPA